MALRRTRRPAVEATIDIGPLIDMVFIQLIFFMVSTTFQRDLKIDIERPGAASAAAASAKAIRVHIERGDTLHLDGQPVRPWMLQPRLRDILRGHSSKVVLVITDQAVSARTLVHVVDQCRLAGALDVGVATQQEAG